MDTPNKKIYNYIDADILFANTNERNSNCLHDNCTKCHGTGVDTILGTMCFHYLYCGCSKCSPI